ncbi:hypothetical protein [Xanthomonas hortorum]|uniref:Morphogenetic protein n=1 Tax=Xanthomonas hortorum pv. vitians TaxID=83224 RepID=A0A6V7EQN8_9XANT|nr:hypothetical protein [Xanthomonas hortorum]APP85455.1 hypothetical protein BI317_16020 [Xanthomonas hortorum pv. gardneri]MCE4302956.1 hypothetical protein [Xanthomonas hortorum pv. vitians]MCE4311077.1 hypothetical protein [Xanthomonas hortorum pv. vitians]MCE4552369.1 hypothetical protein [Xanthomonas hortorum pv. vitians]MDT7825279.1 hypothetical protein [Xanthomonas hortorum pv. vitians]
MKERPILFNGAMVRAILAGAKTQTRRAVKQLADATGVKSVYQRPSGSFIGCHLPGDAGVGVTNPFPCPFGQPGDRLWVRETWMDLMGTSIEHRDMETGKQTRYAYGSESPRGSASDEARKDFGLKWRPSIHMPRSACRLLLEITDVRVERLQAISEADAIAEGIERHDEDGITYYGPYGHGDARPDQAFRDIWTSTGGDWDANPWVWVISFKRIEA